MVKIIEKSAEEIREEERESELAALAVQTLGEKFRITQGPLLIRAYLMEEKVEHYFIIRPTDSKINVYSPKVFDSAYKLAEAYESRQNEKEWSVRKTYRTV
ncbi:hypothetical protein J4462_03085 [Candidatus Pacearchaeota archaeon]|nr:hypothetical protein [Candidatus Pacearchaeota archaeon]